MRRRRLLPILALALAAATAALAPAAGHAPPVPPGWPSWLPRGEQLVGLSPLVQVFFIIVGTLISEDLTCITVGTLIHHGKLPWPRAGVACFLGIYIGDLTFFFLGRLGGRRLLRWRFFSRSLGPERLEKFGEWFDRRPWAAIMACRFLPGIRVPLYLSVGALTHRTKAFFWWTCFFAFVWTPTLIGLVVVMGDAFAKPFERVAGQGWGSIVLEVVALYLVVRGVMLMSTATGRKKLADRFGWLWGRKRDRPAREAAEGGRATPDVEAPGNANP